MKWIAGLVAAAALAGAGPALASHAVYTISGKLTGSFNGTVLTDQAFVFNLDGDTANITVNGLGDEFLKLDSTTVSIGGFATATFLAPTEIATSTNPLSREVVFSQFNPNQRDILLATAATALDLKHSFGPIGSDFSEWGGGDVIHTSGGDLQISIYTDPSFTFSGQVDRAVPEPATWMLMIGGLGLAGGALRARRRAAA
ncbi:MAG: PEPxxWA-CTERM sorting domain-containing protein [Caulobacterales bacterium]|nr:PEPxxWA-CTERM sorting domain-containing protein [Caulobacterales bacterium]